jgi:hypothetical protein
MENIESPYISYYLTINDISDCNDFLKYQINGEIKCTNLDESIGVEDINVGSIEFYILDTPFDNYSFYDDFFVELDGTSGGMYCIAEDFTITRGKKRVARKAFKRFVESRIIIIDEIIIEEKYRGKGLLKIISENLSQLYLCDVFAKPFPLQYNKSGADKNNFDKDMLKVRNSYVKAGYKPLFKNSDTYFLSRFFI